MLSVMWFPKKINSHALYSLGAMGILNSITLNAFAFNLRTMLPNEGYLSFKFGGEERTGWTDIKHPANDGTHFAGLTNTDIGYDRSTNILQINNNILTIDYIDNNGQTRKETANPNIPKDYDFSNQIWNQLGISIVSTGLQNLDFSTGNPKVITAPIDSRDRTIIQALNRASFPVVNNWYGTTGVSPTGGPIDGVTRDPKSFPADSGTMIFDNPKNDTLAHELGHFLLENHEFVNPSNKDHSPLARDLMGGGLTRVPPSNEQKKPLLNFNTAPKDPGLKTIGSIGTTSHFDAPVKLMGAGDPIHQIEAAYRSTYISKVDRGFSYGDRAEFDWIEDNSNLEDKPHADYHPGTDDLVWDIRNLFPPAPDHLWQNPVNSKLNIMHDHGDWPKLLDIGSYKGDTFSIVDVISQIARYSDMDTEPTLGGGWSPRESALDYDIWFSVDGLTNWTPGTLLAVFDDGWTEKSKADDYVARWAASTPSKFVKIKAKTGGNHDGNTQIDAIIASNDTNAYCPPTKINDKLFQFYYSPYGNFQCTFDQSGSNYLLDVTFQPTVNESLGSIGYSLMITDPAWSFESLAFSSGGPSILKEIWYNYPGSDNPSSWSSPNQQLLSTSTLPDLFSPGLKEIWVRDTYHNITPGSPFYSRSAYSQVPGPLPVLGAGAAFRMSRKLRNRIKMTCII
jgi:hypothetical protein